MALHFWEFENAGWIRISGQGNFLNSSEVKEWSKSQIAKGVREFIVDLSECTLLDSTFMGTMAGIALRLRELHSDATEVRLIHVNPQLISLIQNLGLEKLLHIFPSEPGNDTGTVQGAGPIRPSLSPASAAVQRIDPET